VKSVWAIAILAAKGRAGPVVGTRIGAVADLLAKTLHASVLQQTVAGGIAGRGIPPVPVGELAYGAAVSGHAVRGDQETHPAGIAAAAAQWITAFPIHPALVIGRITHADRAACGRECALPTSHTGKAIRLQPTKAEAVRELVSDGGREAYTPWGTIIKLLGRPRKCHRTGLKGGLLLLAGAGRLGAAAVEGVGALLAAPIAAAGLADWIASGGRDSPRAGPVGRGTSHARLDGRAGVQGAPVPGLWGGVRHMDKIRLRTSPAEDKQRGEAAWPEGRNRREGLRTLDD